jgi:hypothetical protein
MYNEDPEIYAEPETEDWYPAVFQRSDIKASHYPTLDMKDQPDDLKIEKIEFKPFNAPNAEEYQEWTDDNNPDYGRQKLRLTMKGDTKIYPILYLPSMLERGKDLPVVRDFENCCLHYVDNNNEVVQTKVDIALDKTPLNISMPLRVWGNDEEYVELDAIQPTLIKEVYLDGRITKYLCEGETFILPYLLKDRISIHDFNREGHSEYECFNVGVLDEKGSIQKWRDWDEESSLKTKDKTALIPEYIQLAYGIPKNNGNITKMLYWDYSVDNPPMEVDLPFTDLKENSILFQDLRQINDNLDCIPPEKNDNLSSEDWDSAWDSVGKQEDNSKQDATLLHCYDIATKYKTYYFIFTPLLNMDSEKDFIKNICIPLKRRQNGSLSEEDMQNLMRCATECGLDWTKIYTKITNN